MTPKQLKELLHAAPFVPFTIVLANGKTYQVGNPDFLNITVQGDVIHQDFFGPATFLNPVLITEIIKEKQAADA